MPLDFGVVYSSEVQVVGTSLQSVGNDIPYALHIVQDNTLMLNLLGHFILDPFV